MKRIKFIVLYVSLFPLFSFSQQNLDEDDVGEFVKQLKFLSGIQAPNFALADTSGRTVDLKAMKNKVVVLDFWFTNCAPCINQIPAYKNLYSSYISSDQVSFNDAIQSTGRVISWANTNRNKIIRFQKAK